MKLVRDAKTLTQKVIHSLKASIAAFNGGEENVASSTYETIN